MDLLNSDHLSYTDDLLNHVYYLEHNLSLQPTSNHHLTAIKFSDIKERRHDFLSELVNTIGSWVYNRQKQNEIYQKRFQTSNSIAIAASHLTNLAHKKFRPGHPQGQFGELLLFNLLQHFFKAAPLLRKQKITTNINLERNGADAIHYKPEAGKHIIYLGESKCYESKYQFSAALKRSLESINETFDNFDSEMDLYVYDDFIEPDLLHVAESYKAGTLQNVQFEFVCLVVYNENKELPSSNEIEIHNTIRDVVIERAQKFEENHFQICHKILSRLHFIIFPLWELDQFLDNFQSKVGSDV
jgi:hypothetical protein